MSMTLKNSVFDKWVGMSVGSSHLEQLVEQSNWGPIFLARTNSATTSYLLRFLIGPTNLTSREQEVYLERFQYQASQIASLQHPYILPLLDFGA